MISTMGDILFFDTETTGLNVWKDRILQIGLIYKGQSKSILINPNIPIPSDASNIHHITDDMVKDCNTFDKIAPSLFKLLQNCSHYAGYNIRKFDLPILQCEMLRCGYEIPDKPIIDVLEQVYLLEPDKRLTSVYRRFFGENYSGAHDGLADCFATKRVYEFIQEKLK